MSSNLEENILQGLPTNGWLTENEAKLLVKYAKTCFGPILEVGCYQGRSTVLLARFGRQIYAVDPFEGFSKHDPSGNETEVLFRRAVEGLTNVELFRMKIEDWISRPVGFAYLDGDHTYQGTINQIKAAKKCNPRLIAVHDVNDRGGGAEVKRACLKLLGRWIERSGRLAMFSNA